MRAVYSYACVHYGHIETEKNHYLNPQDGSAFFASLMIRADRGCKVAQCAVGERLLREHKNAEAAEYLQKSAEQNYGRAVDMIRQKIVSEPEPLVRPTSGFSPLKPERFDSLSGQLKKSKSPDKNFRLGMAWYGQTSSKYYPDSRKLCEEYLTLAAKEGDMNAAYQLYILYEANFFDSNKSLDYFQRALELQHPIAVLENGAKDNPEKQFELYRLYSGKGYKGIEFDLDLSKADRYLLGAAELGHLDALRIVIDLINENRLNLPSDKLEHYKELFFQAATTTTKELSEYELAMVAKKAGREGLARELLLQAAKDGSGKSMMELGQFCDAVCDTDGAVRSYLLKQARRSNIYAMIGLGNLCRKNKKSEEAMTYYKSALKASDEVTQGLIHMHIGQIYEYQYHATRYFDKDKLRDDAITHYTLAKRDEIEMPALMLKAERGEAEAQFKVALFLYSTASFNLGRTYKFKIGRYLESVVNKGYLVEASVMLFKLNERNFFNIDPASDSYKMAIKCLQNIIDATVGSDKQLKFNATQALIELAAATPPHPLLPAEIKEKYAPPTLPNSFNQTGLL